VDELIKSTGIHSTSGRRTRVCMVVPTHWSAMMGGAQYQARLLIEYLAEAGGFEVFYLTRSVAPGFVSNDHEVVCISSRRGLMRYSFALDRKRLIGALRELQPDVIYQRVGCAHTGISAWYARRNSCRMIWHVAHDRTLSPGRHRFSPTLPLRLLDHTLMIYGIRHASTIVAQTKWQQDQLLRRFGRQSVVIPNFHPDPAETSSKSTGPLQVVWIANMKEWKRPGVFLDLAEDCLNQPVEFHMVGKPSQDAEFMQGLRTRVRTLPNVTYHGEQPQTEVNALLNRCHVFVNTSDHEGFANTFVQAWLRGVPVATLRVNPDRVFDLNDIGFCAEGDYGLLRDWLQTMVRTPSRLERLGRQAVGYARQHHSMRNAERLAALLIGVSGQGDQLRASER